MGEYKDIITILALPYLFLVSAMYNFGYWSQFEINILNYINIIDSINSMFIPITNSVLPYLTMVIAVAPIYYIKKQLGKNTRIPVVLSIIIIIFSAVISISLAFRLFTAVHQTSLFNNKVGVASYFILLLLLVLSMIALPFNQSLENKPKVAPQYRKNATYMILFLIPTLSWTFGINNAFNVKNLTFFNQVNISLLENKQGLNNYKTLIFLGKGGDTYFFSTPDFKYKLITDKSKFKNLVYVTYNKKKIKFPKPYLFF